MVRCPMEVGRAHLLFVCSQMCKMEELISAAHGGSGGCDSGGALF